VDYPNLKAEVLTRVVTGIEVATDYPLSRMFGGLTIDVDGDVAKWDEVTPNREIDKRFETRKSQATSTDPSSVTSKAAAMFVNFKKRHVFPEDLDALRVVGGSDTERDRALSNLTWMLGDMKRRYYDEPLEYMIASALQNNQSVTVQGKTVAPDYGLPVSHNLVEVASWAAAATDIDAKVETIKRLLATDAGRVPMMALCGRNIFGYLRKNTAIKSWLQNQTGASQSFDALLQDEIPNLLGLRWVTMRHGYFVSGTFTPYIPDDSVIFVPVPDRSWFQVHRGSVRYPNTLYGQPDAFAKSYGLTSWGRLADEPPSAVVFMRWAGLAIPVFPSAYAVLDVTP
jgi:hypothetical protein